MAEENYKKGTTTVGIVYKDGVVLAADKRASLGHLAMHKEKKVYKVTDFIGLTTAGAVSDADMLLKYLKAEMELYKLERNKEPSIDAASNLLATIVYGGRKSFFPYMIGILMGGKADDDSYKLFSLYADGSSIIEKYTCNGSGMELAIAIMDDEYKEGMSEQDAIKLGIKAVNRATKRDIYTGDGISVSVIDKKGYREVHDK